MANKEINIKVKTTGDLTGINKIRKELKDTKNELADALSMDNVDPKKIEELTTKTAELKDKLADINEQVDVFATGSKYEAVSNSLGAIGSGLANLDFGKASERATAFAVAAKKITFKDAVSSVKDLVKTFATIGKALLTNPLFLVVAAVVALMKKFGLFKKMMEGIGKIVEWLTGLLDSMIETISSAIDLAFGTSTRKAIEAAKELEKLEKMEEKFKGSTDAKIALKEKEIELARAQGKEVKAMEEEKLKMITATAMVEAEIAKRKFIAAKLSGNYNEKELADLKAQATELINIANLKKMDIEIAKEQNKQKDKDDAAAKAKENSAKAKTAADKRLQYEKDRLDASRKIEDNRLEMLEDSLDKELSINNEKYKRILEDVKRDTKLTEDEKTKLTKQYELLRVKEEEKIRNVYNDKTLEEIKSFNETLRSLRNEQLTDEKELARISYEDNLKDLREKYGDSEEFYLLEVELKKKYDKELSDIDKNRAELKRETTLKDLGLMNDLEATSFNQKKSNLEMMKALELENTELTEAEKLSIIEKYKKAVEDLDNEELERKKAAQEASVQLVADGFNFISSLFEANNKDSIAKQKKAFDIKKKADIASTVVSTYMAAQGAYASQMSIPSPDAPVRAAIAASLAVAQGLARVASIKKTQFEGGSTGGGSTSGGGSTPSPGGFERTLPNVSFTGGNNQNSVSAGGTTSMEINVNATVSETEITNVQNMNANRIKNAEL
jgi:hypothetical protein